MTWVSVLVAWLFVAGCVLFIIEEVVRVEKAVEIAFWWPLYLVKWMILSFFRIFK